MSRCTILFVSHDAKLFGAPRSLFNLIQGIQRDYPEINIHVILPYKGLLTDELTKSGIKFSVVYFPWTVTRYRQEIPVFKKLIRRLKKLMKTVYLLPDFIREVKRINPDYIHSNTSAITTGALAAMITRRKHIWHIREFGWEDHRQTYDWTYAVQRFFYNRSYLLISISEAIKKLKLTGLKVPVKQIYNGVYFKDDLVWPAREQTSHVVTFGIVGGIREAKGQSEAIEAFADFYRRHKNARLLIVGHTDINATKPLQQLAVQLECVDAVEFVEFEKNIDAVYLRIDILLSCSRSEGMGRSLVEAMAHGIPVISKNTGGAVEIVVHEHNGFLYTDVADLSLKMEALLTNETYAQYSTNAIEWVTNNFTIEKYTQNVVEAILS
jgi:glycosyltransferase involved in cell wall biosynthesis